MYLKNNNWHSVFPYILTNAVKKIHKHAERSYIKFINPISQVGPQVCHCSHFSATLFLLFSLQSHRTQARPFTFYSSLLSVDDLDSYYTKKRSSLIHNSPLFTIMTAVTPSLWSIFPSFPTISEMRDLCSCKWQCIHMQSWSHPSHFKLG